MPLQGTLQEMSLANLIQVNCQEMRSARLVLTYANQSGEIYFSDGQVVHATLGDLQGEQAVYSLLTWDEGTFILERDVAAPVKTIDLPWQTLLLEGMKYAVERPREEKVTTQGGAMADDVITQLRAISGVEKVVLAASDGVLMDADVRDSDAENQAAVTVFVGTAAQQLSNTLQLGTFVHGVVAQKSRRLLILPQAERYVGLILAENASPTIVANAASEILKK
jgi:predicted regulator of Ras-like GTPase activity (Roadblock/LC7/MglB family)